jgi:hypothetical protein
MFGLWKYLLRSQHPGGLHSFYWTSSPIHHHFEIICTYDVLQLNDIVDHSAVCNLYTGCFVSLICTQNLKTKSLHGFRPFIAH